VYIITESNYVIMRFANETGYVDSKRQEVSHLQFAK
jgi:hypothetical protein